MSLPRNFTYKQYKDWLELLERIYRNKECLKLSEFDTELFLEFLDFFNSLRDLFKRGVKLLSMEQLRDIKNLVRDIKNLVEAIEKADKEARK